MNNVFKLIGDENRYKILSFLIKNGESCVCNLEELLEIKQANLSKHLNIMKKENLLSSKQVGKFVHYSVAESFAKEYKLLIKLIDSKESKSKEECDC